jgi:hypothetical protein
LDDTFDVERGLPAAADNAKTTKEECVSDDDFRHVGVLVDVDISRAMVVTRTYINIS